MGWIKGMLTHPFIFLFALGARQKREAQRYQQIDAFGSVGEAVGNVLEKSTKVLEQIYQYPLVHRSGDAQRLFGLVRNR